MVFGAASLIFGINSCDKDDDNECCTLTYTDGDETYTVRACEDGSITYTYNDQTYSYNWKDDFDSWAEIKAEAIAEGATCS